MKKINSGTIKTWESNEEKTNETLLTSERKRLTAEPKCRIADNKEEDGIVKLFISRNLKLQKLSTKSSLNLGKLCLFHINLSRGKGKNTLAAIADSSSQLCLDIHSFHSQP